jgi:hypothetical protein
MNNYKGVIIEESFANKVKILSTKIEKLTDEHKTPWLSQWTLHTVEVTKNRAQAIAEEISRSLDYSHDSSWYADYKNNTHHYIIFQDKIFYIDRKSKEQYDEAKCYGIPLGIPEYQVDFAPDDKI